VNRGEMEADAAQRRAETGAEAEAAARRASKMQDRIAECVRIASQRDSEFSKWRMKQQEGQLGQDQHAADSGSDSGGHGGCGVDEEAAVGVSSDGEIDNEQDDQEQDEGGDEEGEEDEDEEKDEEDEEQQQQQEEGLEAAAHRRRDDRADQGAADHGMLGGRRQAAGHAAADGGRGMAGGGGAGRAGRHAQGRGTNHGPQPATSDYTALVRFWGKTPRTFYDEALARAQAMDTADVRSKPSFREMLAPDSLVFDITQPLRLRPAEASPSLTINNGARLTEDLYRLPVGTLAKERHMRPLISVLHNLSTYAPLNEGARPVRSVTRCADLLLLFESHRNPTNGKCLYFPEAFKSESLAVGGRAVHEFSDLCATGGAGRDFVRYDMDQIHATAATLVPPAFIFEGVTFTVRPLYPGRSQVSVEDITARNVYKVVNGVRQWLASNHPFT